MKIRSNNVTRTLVVFLCYLAICESVLDIPLIRRMLLVSGVLVLVFFTISAIKRGIRVEDVWIALMIVVFLYRNEYFISKSWIPVLKMILVLLFVIVAVRSVNWQETFFKASFWFYLPHIFATIFFYFNRGLYFRFINAVHPNSVSRLTNWYNAGCMAGLCAHYSTNGMILSASFLLMLSRYIYRRNKKEKNFYLIIIMLNIIAILLTGKRAPVVFLLAVCCLLYIVFYANQKKKRLIAVSGMAVTVLISGVILRQLFPQLFTFISRFQSTAEAGDVSLGRFDLWRMAWQYFRSNWLTGIGWVQFYQKSLPLLGRGYHVHNVYIQLLCETGVIGAAVYFSWFAWMYIRTWKLFSGIRRKNITAPGLEKSMFFSLGMQSYFLLYSLVGNPLYDAPMYAPYFLACAMSLACRYDIENQYKEGTMLEQRERVY